MPKESPTERMPRESWDTGFRIHDAGWAMIAMALFILGLAIYGIMSLFA